MEFDLILLLEAALVFAIAGAVKGVVGFGLPTIAMGLLGALIAPDQAAAILVLPTLLTNAWQMCSGPSFFAIIKRFWPMMAGIVLGTVGSAGIITGANPRVITSLIGAMLIAYALFGLSGRRFRVSRKTEPAAGPSVGLTTGVINGATAIFVMPAVPYLQAIDLDKDELIQALGLSAFISAVALGLGLGVNAGIRLDVAGPTLVALVAAFAGMATGRVVRSKLSIEAFQRWVFIGLVALGAAIIARAAFQA